MSENKDNLDDQTANNGVHSDQLGEQGEQATNTPGGKVEPDLGEWKKGVTIRPKATTQAFYELCSKAHAQLLAKNADASKADACNLVLEEALGWADKYIELAKRFEDLLRESSSLAEQLESFKANANDQPEQGMILQPDANEMKLLQIICRNRFADANTRAAYKLADEETPARMLIHLIRQADNLYNANGNFFTGFSRDQMK